MRRDWSSLYMLRLPSPTLVALGAPKVGHPLYFVFHLCFWNIHLGDTEKVVALGRVELPTCGLGNRRSIHLSYRAEVISSIFS